jgi:hypothetical protein
VLSFRIAFLRCSAPAYCVSKLYYISDHPAGSQLVYNSHPISDSHTGLLLQQPITPLSHLRSFPRISCPAEYHPYQPRYLRPSKLLSSSTSYHTMESMDYNYFTNTGPQAYHYLGYGADGGLLHHGVGSDGTGPTPVSGLISAEDIAGRR